MTRERKNETSRSAFTLLEVLLAVSIFAVVLAAINVVFFSALRLTRSETRWLDENAPLQQALAIIRNDLEGAMGPGGTYAAYFRSSANGMGSVQGGILEFFSTTGRIDDQLPWGEVQRITYSLRDSGNRAIPGRDLYRTVYRNLGPVSQDPGEDHYLLGGIDNVTFEFGSSGSWRSSWDTSSGDSDLPQAVRMQIDMASGTPTTSRNRQPLEMTVLVLSQSRTNQSQSTGGSQ